MYIVILLARLYSLAMKSTSQNIPTYLVYEIYKGKPIHYKGYKDVLKGTKHFEEIMGSSYIQSLIITRLIILLGSKISPDFEILTSELGIKLGKNSRRAADIAILEKSKAKAIKDVNKYLEISPKYVTEVDIKASKDDIEDSTSYYYNKTDQLLDFGVECVIWIFTQSKKIMIAQKGKKNWEITDWSETFHAIENLDINLEQLAM